MDLVISSNGYDVALVLQYKKNYETVPEVGVVD